MSTQNALSAKIDAIKAMNLSPAEERKMMAIIGIDVPKQTFELSFFEVKDGKNKGEQIPLLNVNVGKKTKGITLWQAKAIRDNFDEFILTFEETVETLKATNKLPDYLK
jgi:hypothetical protein